jgi:L-2,4-diaminobutyrate decarboxylase
MLKGQQPDVRNWFPSDDGNEGQRTIFMKLVQQIIEGVDHLKDPNRVNLKGSNNRDGNFYGDLIRTSEIPQASIPMEEVNERLLALLHAHPYHTKYFLTNILPMASIPGILGMITAFMVNGNNLWDVYGPAGAEAEVKITAMMSKLVGYDSSTSGGYTTWGGQGAVFTGLRLAIAKYAPDASRTGVPRHLYAFCSEAAHYSLFKSMEATGLGSDNLIRVRTHSDSSMDIRDLREKIEKVILSGGIPIYIVATTGTTDAMGIDDVKGISELADQISSAHGMHKPHIHADSALGGFFAFYNDYDFASNALGIESDTLNAIHVIHMKMKNLYLADTLCFDFQKLGQTPYTTSLFLVKDANSLKHLDLDPDETPYVGHRGYGEYHTGYTLECSRMASSISIYSALLAFGVEGYQRLLAQLVEVNLAFRKALKQQIPEATIVNPNNPGMITLFRIYPQGVSQYAQEINSESTSLEIELANSLNELLFESLGRQRDQILFGDTKKHLMVSTTDLHRVPLYAAKLFVISPYTRTEHIEEIVSHLKISIAEVYEATHTITIGG